ncbi:hypothetical protein LCGC14_1923030 [marine sediment metagenome]|uniref:Uncharacterized protein n=1 Tax=marine sediment metagenome TaxID=412755 RepID=A0A0F9FPZ7_9ZZZZ
MLIFGWVLVAVLLVVAVRLLHAIVTGKLKFQWRHEEEHTHSEE